MVVKGHKQGKRLVVIGGGAAGFFCAINAAECHPGLEVVLLEKTRKVLSKVRISGGGRCNVTQACSSISEMIKAYPRGSRFLKKAFHQFFTNDTMAWFENRGVSLKVEPDGRMFPVTDSSQTIIDCLLREAEKNNVQLRMGQAVEAILPEGEGFRLPIKNSETLWADYVCVACGGFPKLTQFDWLASLGLEIVPPVPSLFTFNLPKHPITQLMGISVPEVTIRLAHAKLQAEGPILITHWGLSGPAVLKLSALAAPWLHQQNYEFSVQVNWVPEYHEESLRQFICEYRETNGKQKISNKNPFNLAHRLWNYLLEEVGINHDINWADLKAKEQNLLILTLCRQHFDVSGKTTFKEEFVTAGGIALSEINGHTMASKKWPNLFFAGEILDIDGLTGGYNFQNAWTTAIIAARNLA